ncbi:hypothetical protein [Acidisphaera sp. S103]|uniref:hypothetical protein n=1 Tax=Acidisphaera sp. S103 TaxID=1747223 RepID=UPI00131DDA8B|nr:hypothetical protein [Acidisphaera sp. S103]
MPARKRPDPNAKSQSQRFVEMARELWCDEYEAAFMEKLGKIARHKPKDEPHVPQRRDDNATS